MVGVAGGRVRQNRAGGLVREGDGVVERRSAVGQPADVGAVVRVAGGVDDIAHGLDVVGVAVAVGQVGQLTGGPVGTEHALDIAQPAVHGVRRAVEPLAIGAQAHDGGLVAGVLHHGVDCIVPHAAVVLQDGHAIARLGGAVDGAEAAADGHAIAVRCGCDRLHGVVGDLGGEVLQRARAQVEGGHPVAGLGVDLGEASSDVEGRAVRRDLHGLDRGVGAQAQPLAGAIGRRDRAHAVGVGAVELGEVAPDVQGGAIGGGRDGLHITVGGRRPVQQLTGGDVVGHQVAARLLALTSGRARGTRGGEGAGNVDRVADDLLVPHHAVTDLGGGQGVRGDRLRPGRFGRLARLLRAAALVTGLLAGIVLVPALVARLLTVVVLVAGLLAGIVLVARLLATVVLATGVVGVVLVDGRLLVRRALHGPIGTFSAGARYRKQAGAEQEDRQNERGYRCAQVTRHEAAPSKISAPIGVQAPWLCGN